MLYLSVIIKRGDKYTGKKNMHTPRMHKKFLFGESLVGYTILFDVAALFLVALGQKGYFYF
jgi:hypothetical protein